MQLKGIIGGMKNADRPDRTLQGDFKSCMRAKIEELSLQPVQEIKFTCYAAVSDNKVHTEIKSL